MFYNIKLINFKNHQKFPNFKIYKIKSFKNNKKETVKLKMLNWVEFKCKLKVCKIFNKDL